MLSFWEVCAKCFFVSALPLYNRQKYLIVFLSYMRKWFNHSARGRGRVLTVRDILAWVAFINATESNLGLVNSFLHGAFLVLLDGLSLGKCQFRCVLCYFFSFICLIFLCIFIMEPRVLCIIIHN